MTDYAANQCVSCGAEMPEGDHVCVYCQSDGLDAPSVGITTDPYHMTDWISVKDRLPEPWVTVLLWDGDKMVSGYADDDGDLIEHRWGQVFQATHWMLPEPPGGEG